jgi:hypothetical protein
MGWSGEGDMGKRDGAAGIIAMPQETASFTAAAARCFLSESEGRKLLLCAKR